MVQVLGITLTGSLTATVTGLTYSILDDLIEPIDTDCAVYCSIYAARNELYSTPGNSLARYSPREAKNRCPGTQSHFAGVSVCIIFLRICPLVLKAVPGQGIELIRVMTWVPGMLAEVRSQAVAGFTGFDSGVLDDRSDLLCLHSLPSAPFGAKP